MSKKSKTVNFILPELTEFAKGLSNPHHWTIAVSDSKIAIFRNDSGYEVAGFLGMLVSHWSLKSSSKKMIGTDIEDLIKNKKKVYAFNRESGSPIKFLLSKEFGSGKMAFLLLDDGSEIAIGLSKIEMLKEEVPEIEFMYTKDYKKVDF